MKIYSCIVILLESIVSFLRDFSVSYSGQRRASKMALAFWPHFEINIFVYFLYVFYVISGLLIMPEKVATLKKENIELLKSQIAELSSELKNLKWQSFLVFY